MAAGGFQVDEELLKLEVGDLPGVGYSLREKLASMGITRVADVRQFRRDVLQRELGTKTGNLVRKPALTPWTESQSSQTCAVQSAHLRIHRSLRGDTPTASFTLVICSCSEVACQPHLLLSWLGHRT